MKKAFAFTIFALLFVFVAANHETEAQRGFQDHSTVDGVDFQYRWARSKLFDRNSHLELRLKIKNNNDYPVMISYDIEFYMGPKMEEYSETTGVCINPKLARTGRLNGMYYRSSRLSNRQLESEEFSWEISNLVIERRDEHCR